MRDDCILDWLHSVDSTNDQSCERPPKRPRLNNGCAPNESIHSDFGKIQVKGNDPRSRLQTPSTSGSGSVPRQRYLSMTSKRPRDLDDGRPVDDARQARQSTELSLLHTELTPRPRRSPTAALDHGVSLPSSPSQSRTSPSLASSKASKISRNLSPTKQLRKAELEETAEELKMINGGFGILPKELQDELMKDDDSFEFWNFGDRLGLGTTCFPDLSTVRQIYDLARRCFKNNHPESSWNNDVHSRVLNWVLRDGPCKDDIVDYRCCLTAQIAPEYQPINSRSKMVDYCFCIEPKTNSPQYRTIESLCKKRPGKSINHTDWADLTKYPIAISIETKGPSIGYETALLQVATWHSAQWRSLCWAKQDMNLLTFSCQIEFLPGIIVMQHHWWFVATALNEGGKAQTFERLLLGETESLLGIYKLSMALQKLVEWARDQYWPAFQSDVLGL
ncbi:uncharacterized protein N7446_010668 [Penicillium canescens]|nr:uncharacterized protein N7446_010668 [Penicillium canescens]KAJ6050559.1 hypothetical protein N7446_010668 [Penicillium canescens]